MTVARGALIDIQSPALPLGTEDFKWFRPRKEGEVRRGWLKRSLGLIVILVLACSFVPASGAAPANANGGKLRKADREALNQARVQGQATVTLLIAAKRGSYRAVSSGIAGLGGTVRFRDDDLDYLRAIVPTDKVEAVAALDGVQTVNLDEVIPLDDPHPDSAGFTNPQPPPGAGTPRDNPYMPIADTGAAQFMAANPNWDGRNVTVGIVDSGIDLAHPALAMTTTGERKVVDWITYTDPFDDEDPT